MTKDDLIAKLRKDGFTKRGAVGAATTFLESMEFAGMLYWVDNEFFLSSEGKTIQRKVDAVTELSGNQKLGEM